MAVKVAVVSSYLSVVDLELQRALEHAGMDTWIVTGIGVHPQYRKTKINFEFDLKNCIRIKSIHSPLNGMSLHFPFPVMKDLTKMLSSISADIVHTTEHYSSPTFWCNFRKEGWKTIMIERSSPKVGIISNSKIYDIGARYVVLPRIDSFAALNCYAADYLKYLGCRSLIPIIPNPVDVNLFTISTPWQERRNIILYVGRLIKEKLIELIIVAMPVVRQHIPDAELWLIGDGKDESFFRHLASGKEYIKFIGPVPRACLNRFYNNAKVLITLFHHRAAGLGMATEEAISCGVPIVSSNSIAFEDETKKYYYTLADHNSHAIAKSIILSISNGESYSRNARYVAENVYSYAAIGRRYGKIISNML